jgi:hypothetical protein
LPIFTVLMSFTHTYVLLFPIFTACFFLLHHFLLRVGIAGCIFLLRAVICFLILLHVDGPFFLLRVGCPFPLMLSLLNFFYCANHFGCPSFFYYCAETYLLFTIRRL